MKHKNLLITLLALVPLTPAFAADEPEAKQTQAKPIFDGKTLDGWEGDPDFWRVEDGCITGQTTAEKPAKQNTFMIWRAGELDDFELELEYRIVGGNSGIQYRSYEKPDVAKWVVAGYQADIDSTDTWSGILYSEREREILAKRGEKTVIGEDHKPKVVGQIGDAAELNAKIKKEDWNQYRVVARGFQYTHEINGHLMADVKDEDKEKRRRGGILALQLHAGPPMKVQFRNIRLKRLPMEGTKKIVLLAGVASHGYGAHDHYAGCQIMAKCLNESTAGVHATVYRDGWPTDPTAFDNTNGILMYADGGGGHPVLKHLDEMDKLTKKGIGLACMHWGVEVPKGRPGDEFLNWIGGYFEMHWSVNPHWTANFTKLPEHPITRGVKPFSIHDEWYYHMRFRKDMEKVTPILTDIPPESTLERPDGPHSGNPHVRAEKGKPQHVAWATERADGGRGFGFTGAHVHWNWGHPQFRKLVLNALVWVAGADVPKTGVESKPLTIDDLLANHDEPKPEKFDLEPIRKNLEEWNKTESASDK